MNWMMALLLCASLQEGGHMVAPKPPIPPQTLPRIEAEQCSGLLSFFFRFDPNFHLTSARGQAFLIVLGGIEVESLDLDSLEERREFLLGEYVDPADPDSDLRILVKLGNLGAAYDAFRGKRGFLYPPEDVSRRNIGLKWRYDTFKVGLDRLEQDYPPKYHLDRILQEIRSLPSPQQKERRLEWQYKLIGDANLAIARSGSGPAAGMVAPDGRFMWRGEKPNFDEVFGIGNIFTRTMETHALREVGQPRKQGGLERIRPACAQIISQDGRWGFEDLKGASRSLAFYDMKAMKVAWTIDRKWTTAGGAFSPDGKWFLSYGRGPIGIYDMEKQRLDRERWRIGPDGGFIKARDIDVINDDTYAEFSPKGRYLMAMGHLEKNQVAFYDLQADAAMKAIPQAERAFRGWGPLEHTAFFLEPKGLVLRDIRDGERLLELGFPAQLDMTNQDVQRLYCPPDQAGMVLASIEDIKGAKAASFSHRLSHRVARWHLKPQMEGLKKRVEAKGTAK